MASMKPAPQQAAATAPQRTAGRPAARGPAAAVSALSGGAGAKAALGAAKAMPGWKSASVLLGEALAAAHTAVLFSAAGKTVTRSGRLGDSWQPPETLAGAEDGAGITALKKLADAGEAGMEFVVSARKMPRRPCRVEVRGVPQGEQVLVLLGPELSQSGREAGGGALSAAVSRLVPSFLRRTAPPPERDPTLPVVALEATGPDAATRQAAIAESAGYATACDLVAAAVRDRAGVVRIEAGPQGPTVQFDVDGVAAAAPSLDRAAIAAVAGVLKSAAGSDPQGRGRQLGRVTAVVQGKPWACTVSSVRGTGGERIELVIDHARPTFKTLADAGVPDHVSARIKEFLLLESGLIILAAPRRGGLSTLFDGVINAADRLLRDYVLLEDAAAPRPEIANVRPFRWDSGAGTAPVSALDAALRQYPNVLLACDLEDAELARRLVAEAGDGKLVIVGLRGADAVEGIARLVALGVEPQAVAGVLLGSVGTRLLRKLCPKCRREHLPGAEQLAALKIDPGATVTLFRAAEAGCPVCTGTGYLGRTPICELAAGPTLRAAIAKGADAKVLRQAAAKDGMVTISNEARRLVTAGVTSFDEVQRAFRKA